MAYAETLPPSVLKLFRCFNACCLLLTVLVCLDILALPRIAYREKIISREAIYSTTRNRFTGRVYRTKLDNIILTTENFRFPYHRVQNFNPSEADSVRLVTTVLFKIVDRGYMRRFDEEMELKLGAGISGSTIFVPITFGLTALFGVAMRRNKEQLLNAVVVNIILIIIQLWLTGYLSFIST
ncbi:hypothetical protein [Pontibacter pamirensis]|uniref:hypothetical protein n=1 Tax=Pontibacter pamirensis TaxID=2562824 RepID=UPI001389D457|nr:hypothetical protein [Pontibacter pamirensis]